jgi:hypothetical protein
MNAYNFGPAPYPLNKLHLSIQKAAHELGMHLQAPDALIGMSLLAAMSAACQGLIDVKLPTGQIRPVALNLFAIAESGERKSSIDDRAAKALYDLLAQRQAAHEIAMDQYEYDLALWEDASQVLQQKRSALIRRNKPTEQITLELAAHRKIKPAKPRLRQIVRRDLTGRAFADALHGDGESIALMSAEGDILLRSGAMKQLGWLNSAWDGSTLSLDRAEGKGVLARNPRVTVSIMAQPSAFRQYMARHGEQARGTGLLARFLVGWPASTQGLRTLSETEPTWENLTLFNERAQQLLTEYDRRISEGPIERTVITFSDEARLRWINLVNETESYIHPQGDLRDINDFASKACEITGRVAAILHYFSEQEGGITVDTLERAITIVGWHMTEFQRIFSENSDVSRAHGDAHVLARNLHEKAWLKGLCAIRRNDILHIGPVSLRTKARLDPALDVLIANGAVWINQDKSRTRYVNLDQRFFDNFGRL